MEYHWIEDIDDFRKVSSKWDKALAGSGSHNPFLLSDFIITWWKYFGPGKKLRIFVIYDGEVIKGGIPLYMDRGGPRQGFAEFLRYIGGTAANYTEPFFGPEVSDSMPYLWQALSERKDWDILYLSDLRHGDRLFSEVPSVLKKQFMVRVFTDHSNWSIDLSAGLDKYISGLSPKMKRDLRSKRKQLEGKYGVLRLEEVKGAGEIASLFDIYSGYSLDAFAGRGRQSSFEDRRYSSFFREFLGLMEDNGRLDAHLLSAGDEPLAISFGYKFGPGFNWALTAFNSAHKYYRPGYLLIEELLKYADGRGEKRYNWYGYERFYKTQWCNIQEPLYGMLLFRRGFKGVIYHTINSVGQLLRSNKMIVSAVRRLRRP